MRDARAAKHTGIGTLLNDYLNRWLQLQVTQRTEKRVSTRGHRDVVMVCGSCAEKKEKAAHRHIV